MSRAPHISLPLAYAYVRMSTKEQAKGDSLRRQREPAVEYCRDHKLQLVEELDGLPLADIGLSAFTGANITKGALGRFLTAIDKGKIKKGSYLLVESLDRLSRQEVNYALEVFLRIINAGIKLVTLLDNCALYESNSPNMSRDLMFSIMESSRAVGESKWKKKRLKEVWQQRRFSATHYNRPMTGKCPAWLEPIYKQVDGQEKVFEFRVRRDREKIVRFIFTQALAGVGIYKITRMLNDKGHQPWGKPQGRPGRPRPSSARHTWQQSYVRLILKSPAVIGQFQPYETVDYVDDNGIRRKRRAEQGELIKDYYPAIIDEPTFNRVQAGLKERKIGGAGRKGKGFTNLFSTLHLTCARCQAHVHFENKGKNGQYLVCRSAQAKTECPSFRWRYEHFETTFLRWVNEIDLKSILQGDVDNDRKQAVERGIIAAEGSIHRLEEQIVERTGVLDIMKGKEIREQVGLMLEKLGGQLAAARKELTKLEAERDELAEKKVALIGQENIKLLITQLRSEHQDAYKLRSEINAKMKALISEVKLGFPVDVEFVKQHIDENDDDYEVVLAQASEVFFAVRFKNGFEEEYYPSKEDPFEEVVTVSQVLAELEALGYDISDPAKALEEWGKVLSAARREDRKAKRSPTRKMTAKGDA